MGFSKISSQRQGGRLNDDSWQSSCRKLWHGASIDLTAISSDESLKEIGTDSYAVRTGSSIFSNGKPVKAATERTGGEEFFLKEEINRIVGGAYRRTVRKILPSTGHELMNSVPVNGERKLFDKFLPYNYHYSVNHIHENGLLEAQKEAEDVNKALVIGGGYGVSSIHLAKQHDAEVQVYEAGAERCEKIQRNVEVNGLEDQVSLTRAIVGEAITIKGGAEGAETVPITDLEINVDLIELDCEGVEAKVIEKLESLPEYLVVEFHPKKVEQDFSEFQDLLKRKGYVIRKASGHDGVEISLDQCKRLSRKWDRKDQQYLENGARAPLIVFAEKVSGGVNFER